MPRKKSVPSEDEKRLIVFTREYIEYLLGYDNVIDILSSIERNSVRDFKNHLVKLDQPDNLNAEVPEFYSVGALKMDRKFFRILDAFLEEIAESKSPALRTLSWRARHLRPLLNGFPAIFAAR